MVEEGSEDDDDASDQKDENFDADEVEVDLDAWFSKLAEGDAKRDGEPWDSEDDDY